GGPDQELITKINKTQKDTLFEDGRAGVHFTLHDPKNENIVVKRILWIGEKEGADTLIHELFHAVCEIMAYKNVHLERMKDGSYLTSPEEAYAYLLEFFWREVNKRVKLRKEFSRR
ncbi:MAG: hypothetical protein AAB877_00090, partial [Patescibacteria group bacterium]